MISTLIWAITATAPPTKDHPLTWCATRLRSGWTKRTTQWLLSCCSMPRRKEDLWEQSTVSWRSLLCSWSEKKLTDNEQRTAREIKQAAATTDLVQKILQQGGPCMTEDDVDFLLTDCWSAYSLSNIIWSENAAASNLNTFACRGWFPITEDEVTYLSVNGIKPNFLSVSLRNSETKTMFHFIFASQTPTIYWDRQKVYSTSKDRTCVWILDT